MRGLILLCLFAAVTGTVLQVPLSKSLHDLLQQWKKTGEPYITECSCQAKDKQEHLLEFYDNGIISDDPCFKCAGKCIMMKVKFLQPDGSFNMTIPEQLVPGTAVFLQGCYPTRTTTDLCQKAYELTVCFHKVVLTLLNQSVDNTTVKH